MNASHCREDGHDHEPGELLSARQRAACIANRRACLGPSKGPALRRVQRVWLKFWAGWHGAAAAPRESAGSWYRIGPTIGYLVAVLRREVAR